MRNLPITLTPLVLLAGMVLGLGCGGDGGPRFDPTRAPSVDLDGPPAERLSEYNLLRYDGEGAFTYNARVVPYELNTPLFTDYALKARAIFVPEGSSASMDGENVLNLPVGSVLIKSFMVADDLRTPDQNVHLIETRLLIRHEDGWRAFPYVWDDNGREAYYTPQGDVRDVSFIDATGESRTANYLVPQRNQCVACHAVRNPDGSTGDTMTVPIGPRPRNLDRDYDFGGEVGLANQLEHLADLGMLSGLPDVATIAEVYDFTSIEAGGVQGMSAEDIEFAARSYLDVNCGHCHNPEGVQGVTSQLFLNLENEDMFRLGVCKRPGSAGAGTGGLTYDIVPGDPDMSILHFRMETEEVGAMMPLLGRSVTHDRGVELIRAWIAQMPADDCSSATP